MTLSDLQNAVAIYHQKQTTDFTINGVDMFLLTANSVRKQAEQLHNFELSRCRATLDIDGVTGGALKDVVFVDPIAERTVTDGVTNATTRVTSATANFQNPRDFGATMSGSDIVAGTRIIAINSATSVDVWPTTAGPDTGLTITIGSNVFASVKEVVAVQRRRKDGRLVPMDFTRSDIPIERDRWVHELRDDMWPEIRYPSDAQVINRDGRSTIIQRRDKLFVYPAWTPPIASNPLHVHLECIGWLFDYTDDSYNDTVPSDFLLEFGWEFLKWEIILQFNPIFSTFVPRQEGNVGNSFKDLTKLRDDAWTKLIEWDSNMIDNNVTRSR